MKYRYLIKSTYTDGPHKGAVALRRKGGHITTLSQYQDDTETYSSFGFAQKVCNQLKKDSDTDFDVERRWNEYNIQKGKPGKTDNQFIHWHEDFEPIRVDPDTARADIKVLQENEIAYLEEHYI